MNLADKISPLFNEQVRDRVALDRATGSIERALVNTPADVLRPAIRTLATLRFLNDWLNSDADNKWEAREAFEEVDIAPLGDKGETVALMLNQVAKAESQRCDYNERVNIIKLLPGVYGFLAVLTVLLAPAGWIAGNANVASIGLGMTGIIMLLRAKAVHEQKVCTEGLKELDEALKTARTNLSTSLQDDVLRRLTAA